VQLHEYLLSIAEDDLASPPTERGKELNFHHAARACVGKVLNCAMAFLISSDERFLVRAVTELTTVASFPNWFDSHFLDVAEMSVGVALGYDWLYDYLSEQDRTLIRNALVQHSLGFAHDVYVDSVLPEGAEKGRSTHTTGWVNTQHNWNQVCNCGMVAAALAVADDEPDLARMVIDGAVKSLTRSMKMYEPDGAYPEGPQYWGYGTSFNVYALAMMESALGTDFGLSTMRPGFAKTALFRRHIEGPTGNGFNFADGSPVLNADAHYTWLSKRFSLDGSLLHSRQLLSDKLTSHQMRKQHGKKKLMEVMGTKFKKDWNAKFDRFIALHALWFPSLPGATSAAKTVSVGVEGEVSSSSSSVAAATFDLPLDAYFRGISEVALLRSSWTDPDALWVGLKGGKNGHHHGHLALGAFVLESGGVRWGVDLGSDDYNLPAYNSRKPGGPRWTYLRVSNAGHSTLTVGSPSSVGEALQDIEATASVTNFYSSPARSHAVLDLSNVYPENGGRRVLRGIALVDNRSRLLMQDEVHLVSNSSAPSSTAVIWRMLTEAQVTVSADGSRATLEMHGKSMLVEILSPAGLRFQVAPATPSNRHFEGVLPVPPIPSFNSSSSSSAVRQDGGAAEDEDEDEDEEDEDEDEDEEDAGEDQEDNGEKVSGRGNKKHGKKDPEEREREKAARKAARKEERKEERKAAKRAAKEEKKRAEKEATERYKAAMKAEGGGGGGGGGRGGGGEKKAKKNKKKEQEEDEEGGGGEMGGVEWEVSTKNIRRGVVRSSVLEDPNEGVSILSIEATFAVDVSTLAVLFTPNTTNASAHPSIEISPIDHWPQHDSSSSSI